MKLQANIQQHLIRPWQTRTHCCRHKMFLRLPARATFGTQKCFWFCSETFCVCNKCFPVCTAQETSWATMCHRLPGPIVTAWILTSIVFISYITGSTLSSYHSVVEGRRTGVFLWCVISWFYFPWNMNLGGGVRFCGDAVLRYFWCGFAVILILTCGIAASKH